MRRNLVFPFGISGTVSELSLVAHFRFWTQVISRLFDFWTAVHFHFWTESTYLMISTFASSLLENFRANPRSINLTLILPN